MVVALGVKETAHIKLAKNTNLRWIGGKWTMSDKELLQPRGISSEELNAMIEEYMAKGGKVSQYPPGVALNFRADVLSDTAEAVKKNFRVKKKR